MVGNDHQVTNLERRIHATGSIGKQHGFDTQEFHEPDRKNDLVN